MNHLNYTLSVYSPDFAETIDSLKDKKVLTEKAKEIMSIANIQIEYLHKYDWKEKNSIDFSYSMLIVNPQKILPTAHSYTMRLFSISDCIDKQSIFENALTLYNNSEEHNTFLNSLKETKFLPYIIEPDSRGYNTEDFKIISFEKLSAENKIILGLTQGSNWILVEEEAKASFEIKTSEYYSDNQTNMVLVILVRGGTMSVNINNMNSITELTPVLDYENIKAQNFYNNGIQISFKKDKNMLEEHLLPYSDNIEYPKKSGFIFKFIAYSDFLHLKMLSASQLK